ncbi:MAG: DUF1552 domain-containing protein [Myxococcota bacterium]
MPFSRRSLLRGLGLGAGASILAPMVSRLLPEAMGQSSATKRFILFTNNNGVRDDYRPVPSPTGIDLKSWAALGPHADDLVVLRNVYSPFDLDLHGNDWPYCATPGQSVGGNVAPGGPSIDRFIADQIGTTTALKSINISLWLGGSSRELSTQSADGPGVALPADGPIEAFNRVFGSGMGMSTEEMSTQLQRDRSVLDGVTADIQRMNGRLAGPERERMDQYLQSVRDLETQLGRVADTRLSCSSSLAPDLDVIGSGRSKRSGSDVRPERMDAGVDMLLAALTCGFTNVGAFVSISARMEFLINDPVVGQHTMWHGDGTFERHDAFYDYQAQQIAKIWQALKDTPEGDGSMADNTVFFWGNTSGGNHHNGSYDAWNMILHGGLRGNRVIELPMSPVESGNDPRRSLVGSDAERAPKVGKDAPVHALNDVLTTVAHLAGAPVDGFGDPRATRGVLTDVMS